MPRVSRRRYAKKRSSRALRTSSIFGKTSAKSQARQIAALKRRVSRVYKNCRPEIKSFVGDAETISYTSSSTSSYYRIYPLVSPVQGTSDEDRVGNAINVKSLKLYLTAEYFNNSSTGYHNSESAGCQVRVVVGQFRTAHASNAIPFISELFEYSAGTGPTYTQMSVVPLKQGITTKYRILRDYRFPMTTDRNQKIITLDVKPRNYKWYTTNVENHNNCWVAIVVTGLHWDEDFKETCMITFSNKIVYTDA